VGGGGINRLCVAQGSLCMVSGWQSLFTLPQGFQRNNQLRTCNCVTAAGLRPLGESGQKLS